MEGHLANPALLSALPPPWPDPGLRTQIAARHQQSRQTLVVIDDDPTGCQTVSNVPLLLEWSIASLVEVLSSQPALIYILTNSRAVSAQEAAHRNQEVALHLQEASAQTWQSFSIVSRSDSTLRGHFWPEIEALEAALGPFDGIVLAPYFGDGQRVTLGDIHYLMSSEGWVPVDQSPFAADPVFGYTTANLRGWVADKSGGRWLPQGVASIALETIRQGGPQQVARLLLELPPHTPVVVNAVCDRDLEVVALALLETEAQGKRWLPRTAASFVKIRAGQPDWPFLLPSELSLHSTQYGGLVVAGSYVPQTSWQLTQLLEHPQIKGVELDVVALLRVQEFSALAERLSTACAQIIMSGQTAVLYTSRQLHRADSPEAALEVGQRVMRTLCNVVRQLPARPAFIVAKGGITSHQIASLGLGCTRATVLGQVAAGVPLWRLDRAVHFSQIPYVVFPGNVGGPGTLLQVVAQLASLVKA